MVLSSLPLPPPLFLPPSLPFSLSPVQHPGLKILRSDSSSSISSRIGWVSPLSLTLSLSPNCLSFLHPVCLTLFFHLSWTLSSRFLLFSLLPLCCFFLVLSHYLHLFFFFGLLVWPCCCALLTVITWLTLCLPTVLLFLSPDLPPPPAVASHASSDLFFLNTFQGSLTLVRTPIGLLCVFMVCVGVSMIMALKE